MVDKLIDECTKKTIEEEKLAKITNFKNGSCERSYCIVYIVLVIVVFTIFTGITVYLVYCNWSLIKNIMLLTLNLILIKKQKFGDGIYIKWEQ